MGVTPTIELDAARRQASPFDVFIIGSCARTQIHPWETPAASADPRPAWAVLVSQEGRHIYITDDVDSGRSQWAQDSIREGEVEYRDTKQIWDQLVATQAGRRRSTDEAQAKGNVDVVRGLAVDSTIDVVAHSNGCYAPVQGASPSSRSSCSQPLLQYRHVHEARQERPKHISFFIAWAIASTPVLIWQCSPIPYFWERYSSIRSYAATHAHCLPQLAHQAAPSITSTLSDCVILVIPIAVLSRLQTPLKKKIGLLILFSFGAFVVAAGIVRIYFVFQISNTEEVTTWNDDGTAVWTAVETK
ncbi:hypothetical protein AC579_6218 [Pseudocercospora musae]|uniref:Rhodopsin domain-containing protein n=1 Tax=Pseudocercospora musae TaxID=113226 RepID=A0A139ICI1_9PEZI|nr:hypothetical protein AC579_6218 [Pseudocercospora musae]